jgi:hypothetical protein
MPTTSQTETPLTLRHGLQLVGLCGDCGEEESDLAAVSLKSGFMCCQCASLADGDKPLYNVDGTPSAWGEVFIKRAQDQAVSLSQAPQ